MNSTQIQKELRQHFGNYDYMLLNSFIFNWESDYFCISKSGYTVEVEVKISKGDFKADFRKTTGSGINKHLFLSSPDKLRKPNRFFFACPENLIMPDEIPKEYGLIWIKQRMIGNVKYTNSEIIRDAKFLHKTKIFNDLHLVRQLMNKFYYRNIELRQALNIDEFDIKYKQKRIEFY